MPLTPNNREEHWLQGMVDGETTLTPNKRREYWYKEIVDAIGSGGGGGGGTGGGVFVVTIEENKGTYSNPSATFSEILSASEDGKAIILVIPKEQDASGSQFILKNISTTEAVFYSFYAALNPPYLEAIFITCTSSNVWSDDFITIIGD